MNMDMEGLRWGRDITQADKSTNMDENHIIRKTLDMLSGNQTCHEVFQTLQERKAGQG